MFCFDAYGNLPLADQFLHGLHFILSAMAVLVGCVPLKTEKGSLEHKTAGLVYLPLSLVTLFLGSVMAWREASLVLFCFDSFCAYLLLSGWRAVHEKDAPDALDWAIPLSLLALGFGMAAHGLIHDEGRRSFYLIFFALNAVYLGMRDIRYLRRRAEWHRNRVFLSGLDFKSSVHDNWMSRHMTGMIGSMTANLSVVVLTLLPISLHWLWPVALIITALVIARKQNARQRSARVFNPAFETGRPKSR